MARTAIRPATDLDEALPKLCELLRKPTFFDWACQSLGIRPTRARARLKTARRDGALPEDVAWATEIERALADGKMALGDKVVAGWHPSKIEGGPDWKSSAWFLERLDRKHMAANAAPEPDDEEQAERVTVTCLPPAAVLQAELDKTRAELEALKAKCT